MRTNIIYNKSSLSMPEIDDNSIDTIVTSCPYWGLRNYGKGANQIWDGVPGCKHRWGNELVIRERGSIMGPTAQVGNQRNSAIAKTHSIRGRFCQLCGAWYGQLGLEPTLELYLEHMLLITKECHRVLKPTGVMWWNHGDNYNSKRSAPNAPKLGKRERKYNQVSIISNDIPLKCLCLQNYRLILRMIDEQGWILRNTVIWNKPNNMPSSTKDRLTNKYEPVFFLVKNIRARYYWNEKTGLMASKKPSKDKQVEGVDWDWQEVGFVDKNTFNVGVRDVGKERFMEGATEKEKKNYGKSKLKKKSFWHSLNYWFDLDAIREKHKYLEIEKRRKDFADKVHYGGQQVEMRGKNRYGRSRIEDFNPSGKNPSDVWTIPTQPYPEAHFATFPEKLIFKPIISCCPEWICKKCGKAKVRITKVNQIVIKEFKDKGKAKKSVRGL